MAKKMAIAAVAIVSLAVGLYALYRYYYPLGMTHRCDKMLYFALVEYADKHDGAFPTGEATPEASISLVHSLDEFGHEYAYLLRRRDVSEESVREILRQGELLGPKTCGWNYVEGLRKDSSSELALFWDKECLGHNGERLSEGGHIVTFVGGWTQYIPESEWNEFLVEQRRFRTEEKRKRR